MSNIERVQISKTFTNWVEDIPDLKLIYNLFFSRIFIFYDFLFQITSICKLCHQAE